MSSYETTNCIVIYMVRDKVMTLMAIRYACKTTHYQHWCYEQRYMDQF